MTTPSWFTTRRLLILFCVVYMINYLDRGTIASNGVNGKRKTCDDKGICKSAIGIQGDFGLTNFQDDLLSCAFMVGLLVSSLVLASLAKKEPQPF
ncbi:probable sphingolipid transporter spinster homolog 2 [Hibiscus syriacus]|uniref:probable sphingolipid transporter spinster homolog 2 n=1 Tax=Hibiscus syriacus TaxID=106335 RepID=UPI00192149FA|nr:probable sphingolipid transporter spinster homolog 2 [Hibiscus syriacus]